MRHSIQICVAAAAALVLSGCAGVNLYSETRDKQGQAAKKAWGEVDASARIKTARDNLKTLLDRELATEDHIVLVRRNELIRSMATGATVGASVLTPTDAALQRLAGSPALADAWLAASDREKLVALELEAARQQFLFVGVEMPGCDQIGSAATREAMQQIVAAGGLRGSTVAAGHSAAVAACGNPDRTATGGVAVGGTIGESVAELAARMKAIEAARANTLEARNSFRVALEAHEKASADLAVDPQAFKKVQEAAVKLQGLVSTLTSATDTFSISFITAQRRESLEKFLAAVADTKAGEPPPEGASKAAIALILFPQQFDEMKQALADAKKPLLVPLVLQKRYEQIKLDGLTRDLAAQEASIALLKQKLALQTSQASQYAAAANGLRSTAPRHLASTFAIVLADQAPSAELEERKRIVEATGLFLDAEGRLRGEIAKLSYLIQSARHESALAYAESSAAQWEALIGSGVDQLAEYGGTGIKPELIVSLLNSLTLLWIGTGVNK